MRVFAAQIKGVTEYLHNRYLLPAEVQHLGKMPPDTRVEALEEWRKQEAWLRMYRTTDGLPCVPGRNVRASMVDGANFTGLKHKQGATKSKLGPFLRRGIQIEPRELVFSNIGEPTLHGDIVRIPPGKGALVYKYWPMHEPGWTLDFDIMVFDDSLDSEGELRQSLENAGIFAPMGTGKPDYGKYTVTLWEERRD